MEARPEDACALEVWNGRYVVIVLFSGARFDRYLELGLHLLYFSVILSYDVLHRSCVL